MTDLTKPKRGYLNQPCAKDDDLESQLCVMRLENGKKTFDGQQATWFNERHSGLVLEVPQGTDFQPVLTIMTKSVMHNPTLLPVSGAQVCRPATAHLVPPHRGRGNGPNPQIRNQADDYVEQTSDAAQPSRPRSRSPSDSPDSHVSEIFEAPDARLHEHRTRRTQLAEFLEPLLPPSNFPQDTCILMCWGRSDLCHIRGVFLQDPTDEATIWSDVRRAWIASRGAWEKPFRCLLKVKDVEIVNLHIAGKDPRYKHGGLHKLQPESGISATGYIGTFSQENIESDMNRLHKCIANYVPQEFPCWYDETQSRTQCTAYCVTSHDDMAACPEQKLRDSERDLLRLNIRGHMQLAFKDPEIAKLNRVLDRTYIVYGSRDFLQKLDEWHNPSLREIPFRAIYIEETWAFEDLDVALPLMTAALLCLVLACKFAFGDWGVAWNVGCFFATLATISLVNKSHKGR